MLFRSAQVAEALSSSPLFEGITLASMPRIMKASPSTDMSVIWIDIWNSQKGSKDKTLINHSFNFGHHTATVRGTAMHPGVTQCRNCWHWEHPTHACHAQGAKCQKCGVSRSLTVNFIFIFSFHFILFSFSFSFIFSIFRTTWVRVCLSHCHISHKLIT